MFMLGLFEKWPFSLLCAICIKKLMLNKQFAYVVICYDGMGWYGDVLLIA